MNVEVKTVKLNAPPCRKCGLTIRDVNGKCPACCKRRAADYFKNNKDKLALQRKTFAATIPAEEKKARNKKYKLASQEKHTGRSQAQGRARYAADPEKHKAYQKKYRDNNREKMRAKDNERNRMNPEKVKARNDAYRAANLEKERARNAEWAKKNQDNVHRRSALRRARQLNAKTEIFLRTEVFDRDKWICQLCHKKVNKKLKYPNPMSASIDHIIPLSLGGPHNRTNTQLAHLICNEKASVGGIKQLRIFG